MKYIKLIKEYRVYILAGLLATFFIRSCTHATHARKSDNMVVEKNGVIDSLNNIINYQRDTIVSFPETLRSEKIKIHSGYDNYISKRDRGDQLMDLHMIVKVNLNNLRNVK